MIFGLGLFVGMILAVLALAFHAAMRRAKAYAGDERRRGLS